MKLDSTRINKLIKIINIFMLNKKNWYINHISKKTWSILNVKITLKQLEVFLAIYRHGSTVAAAKQVFLSQSAVRVWWLS